MISEGSCDTEDWSNDAENSLIKQRNYILKYIKIENCILNCNNISQNNSFFLYFWSNRYSLDELKKLL